MRKSAIPPLLLALGTIVPACVSAGETTHLPSFALLGLNRASSTEMQDGWALPHIGTPLFDAEKPSTGLGPRSLMQRVQLPKAAQKSTGDSDDTDDDDDDENPVRPGRPGNLPTNFVKLPSLTTQMKPRATLGPHLRPDAEFDLNDRTSIGILGIADGLKPSTVPSALGKVFTGTSGSRLPASSNVKPRDIGIGASFEIKFGP